MHVKMFVTNWNYISGTDSVSIKKFLKKKEIHLHNANETLWKALRSLDKT